MRRFLPVAALLAASILAVAPSSHAADESGPPLCEPYEGVVCTGWFSDDAELVVDDQRIEDAIDRLVGRYGREIAVVTVTDSRGEDPADFAAALGNAWGVGGPAQDGVVVLVDIGARRTEVKPASGLPMSDDAATRVAGAANSFFGVGDFEGGLLAIVGSLEQELAALEGDAPGEDGAPATTLAPESPGVDEPVDAPRGGGVGVVVLGLAAGIGLIGGGAAITASRRRRRSGIMRTRRELIDGDMTALEPAGHELPQLDEYTMAAPEDAPDVPTKRVLDLLAAVDSGTPSTDEEAARAAWRHGLVHVIDRSRLEAASEVPFELARRRRKAHFGGRRAAGRQGCARRRRGR